MKLPILPLPKLPKLPKLPSIPSLPKMALPGGRQQVEEPGPEPTVEEKVTEIRTEFMQRAKTEAKRLALVTDTEYWCCLCFETREQKEAFLKALGLWEIGDKYIDGIQAARKLGVDVGARAQWPKTKGLSERLKKHVG